MLVLFDHFQPLFSRTSETNFPEHFIYLEDKTEQARKFGLLIVVSDMGCTVSATDSSPREEAGWFPVTSDQVADIHRLLLHSLSAEQCVQLINNQQYVAPYSVSTNSQTFLV